MASTKQRGIPDSAGAGRTRHYIYIWTAHTTFGAEQEQLLYRFTQAARADGEEERDPFIVRPFRTAGNKRNTARRPEERESTIRKREEKKSAR